MQVENYIQELLFEHNCVVIPDFGGFIAELKGVEIHPITHRFTPPTKRIAFNEQLKVNDGLLVTTIAREEGIEMEAAYEQIRKFVSNIREELRTNNNYIFQEIGKLFYNVENRLEFEPDTRVNYLEESFGFQELFFKPIDRKLTDMSSSQRPVRPVVRKQINTTTQSQKEISTEIPSEEKSSALKMILIIVPLLLLVGAGALIVYSKNNNKDGLASFNIFRSKEEAKIPEKKNNPESEVTSIEDSLVAVAKTDTSSTYSSQEVSTEIGGNTVFQKEENPTKQNLIDKQKELSENKTTKPKNKEDIGAATAHHGRYFVIVGSFINRDNAYKFRNTLAAKGSNVTVLEPSPDNKFYKVAIDDFDNKDDAMKKKSEVGSDFGSSAWVMSY
jgi:cell division septation protein DedD